MIKICQLKGAQSHSSQDKVKLNKLCIIWEPKPDAVTIMLGITVMLSNLNWP